MHYFTFLSQNTQGFVAMGALVPLAGRKRPVITSKRLFSYNIFYRFRIRKIENLDALTKLDVLDLHGNKVSLGLIF